MLSKFTYSEDRTMSFYSYVLTKKNWCTAAMGSKWSNAGVRFGEKVAKPDHRTLLRMTGMQEADRKLLLPVESKA